MKTTLMQRLAIGSAATAAALGGALAASTPAATANSGTKLSGVLKLTAGRATVKGGKVTATGTYFRMLTPGEAGYVPNPDSTAGTSTLARSYTLLRPGTAGGLELGRYQPAPNPAFASNGYARANSIVQPAKFQTIAFSIQTSKTDAQTHSQDPAPSLTLHGTKITGNLSAWDAQWNREAFNQGSPKPTGSAYGGGTRPVTGTYNPKTHAFTITWYSHIVGGPFNNYTGYWHLQGKLVK